MLTAVKIFDKISNLAALNKTALAMRKALALELSTQFRNPVADAPESSDSSHFSLFREHFSGKSSDAAVAFGDEITERALELAAKNCDSVEEYVYLAARLIEQRFYVRIDPCEPEDHSINLAVAKHFGTFFTPPTVARLMAKELVSSGRAELVLDPCCGSGVLLAEVMLHCAKEGIKLKKIVGIELDAKTASWAKDILIRIRDQLGLVCDLQIIAGDVLEILSSSGTEENFFDHDIIINPPYGRIRFQRNRLTNRETVAFGTGSDIELQRSAFTDHFIQVRKSLRVSLNGLMPTGMLEWSQLFFRLCLKRAERGASVVIISPDSWLSSVDAADLRGVLIKQAMIKKLFLYSENAKLFSTVNQPTCIAVLSNGLKTSFSITNMTAESPVPEAVAYSDLEAFSERGYIIPRFAGATLALYKKFEQWPTIGASPELINARGEVDQTIYKHLFSRTPTAFSLVRGEHVTRFAYSHESTGEKPSFLKAKPFRSELGTKPKWAHLSLHRIVGRQCSYMSQRRRLYFAIIPPGHAVGNSCNYLTSLSEVAEAPSEALYYLLGLLNSAAVNWFFSMLNSNNHVANYEIANLPVPSTNGPFAPYIAYLSRAIERSIVPGSKAYGSAAELLLEAFVDASLGLGAEADLPIVHSDATHDELRMLQNYVRCISVGIIPRLPLGDVWFNHEPPTLSALDMDMIRSVPEGGNWQSIPQSIPSKRLEQIRTMTAERGVVRTTYYGRLRRDQPAYTISTYFDRPGNGTHIHPLLDRTLTAREAARLQSFPDSYVFLGSAAAVRTQIGNAVPPLLARAVGADLAKHADNMTCVDLFCGAGGLSLGLEKAGWNVVAAIDNDAAAIQTYGFNRPCVIDAFEPVHGTALYRRDLHDEKAMVEVVRDIKAVLNGKTLDLLVGGPPCQGFSHAGFRDHSDRRNDLAAAYLRMAEQLQPKLFLLENVEGLLTFKGGQVVRDICKSLEELGYAVSYPIWKLCAEEYGVPQMRRRVFIVASRVGGVEISPPPPEFQRCAGRRKPITPAHSSDIPLPRTVSTALQGLSTESSCEDQRWIDWVSRPHWGQ